jgi:hypothetical protein
LEDECPTTGYVQGMTSGEVGVKHKPKEKTTYLVGGLEHDMWQGKVNEHKRRNTLLGRVPRGTKLHLGLVKGPLKVEGPLQGGD